MMRMIYDMYDVYDVYDGQDVYDVHDVHNIHDVHDVHHIYALIRRLTVVCDCISDVKSSLCVIEIFTYAAVLTNGTRQTRHVAASTHCCLCSGFPPPCPYPYSSPLTLLLTPLLTVQCSSVSGKQ
jgi:hypothetical protein